MTPIGGTYGIQADPIIEVVSSNPALAQKVLTNVLSLISKEA